MASATLVWSGGFDIHVLPGETSASLLDFLFIFDDATPTNVVAATTPPADVASIAFVPNFVSTVAPPASPTNGGVHVNTTNGVVTVDAAPTLKSFVLEAVVKLTNGKTLEPIPIRVLVHRAIREMWLTPSPLTIRKDSPGQRLTVLAQFEDDTVGDITRRPGIAWSSNNATKIAVAVNGELTATSPAIATIKAVHAGKTATAQVEAKGPWSTPVALTLIPGSAGLAKAAKVPNVLFLSEGFKASEQPKYEALVRGLVQRMLSEPSLRPFDLVKGKVNFWMAFVPSRDQGTSPLYDMATTTYDAGHLVGQQTPAPVKPPPPPPGPPTGTAPPGAPYTLENLIYQVGLPSTGDASVPFDAARLAWLGRYGDNIDQRVSNDLYLKWLDLRDHRLANEVDTAFGIGNGDRPKMQKPAHKRIADFNPLRTTRGHLDVFLKNLRVGTTSGPAIGAIWATNSPPDPAGAGLPAGLKAGQDSRYVFMLLGGTPYTGVQHDGLVVVSLEQRSSTRVQDFLLGPRQVDFVPYGLPAKAPLELVSRVAHETGHAFGLDDEYGEFKDPLRIPAMLEGELASMGNTQPGSKLERSATDRTLDPAKLTQIKWLWPRIEHAGVLAAQPVASGAAFAITLTRGHARGLKEGDFIRLRHRPLLTHPEASGRLRIDKVNGDVVTATPAPGTSITVGDWHPSDILIRPVRGAPTPGDRDGADLTLVAPIILEHLSASALPLDLAPGSPPAACAVDERDVQKPANLPTGLPFHKPRWTAEIVGLYDGGHRYFCGVYHPSGACVMRSHDLIPMAHPSRENTLMFCPVCRYVLVDQLDPTKHRNIDKDYAARYPQP